MYNRRSPVYFKLIDYIANCKHQDANYFIAKTLLENIDEFPEVYIETIAYLANTTAPTVTKFAKKLAYGSFKELKEDLYGYMPADSPDLKEDLEVFLKEDAKKTEAFFNDINFDELTLQIQDIISYKQIIILNSDYSKPFGNQLRGIFEKRNYKVYLLDRKVDKTLLFDLALKDTILIIISLSGQWIEANTERINDFAHKEIPCYFIAPKDIVQNNKGIKLPEKQELFSSFYHSNRYLGLIGKAIEFTLNKILLNKTSEV